MTIIEYLLAAILAAALLFPVLFAFVKKVNRMFLFIAASYGAEQLVTILLGGVVLPWIVFVMFYAPQLEVNGQITFIRPLLDFSYAINSYWYLAYPMISIAAPLIIYRRYRHIFTR